MERQRRKEDIEKGLQFIQSTVPFPGTHEDYEAFLYKLVKNLFAEGNALYWEAETKLALGQYTEGLNVADYAVTDDVTIAQELVCKLHVNRAACYFAMGLYEKALEDSEKALSVDKENIRALFRKARALNELGRHQEAYDCSRHCLLSLPHDESVINLGKELAQKLGLKVRKAYKRAQELGAFGLLSNGTSTSLRNQTSSNGLGSINDIETDFSVELQCIPAPLATSIPVSDVSVPSTLETKSLSPPVPTTLSISDRLPVPESVEEFPDGDIIGEELDSILDSITDASQLSMLHSTIPTNLPSEMPQLIPVFPGGTPLLPPVVKGNIPVSSSLPPASFGKLSMLDTFDPPGASAGVSLNSLDLLQYPESRLDTLDSFENSGGSLDALDSFPTDIVLQESKPASASVKPVPAQASASSLNSVANMSLDMLLPYLPSTAIPGLALLVKNPLASTYEFSQACNQCYQKTGSKALDYMHKEGLEHKCKKDVLLARQRSSEDKTWKRIRPRPTKTNFVGSYCLCKDIVKMQDCKYGDNCTFGYYQEEIDVWTEERKGTLNRDLLFNPLVGIRGSSLTVSKLLQDHQGIFMFLCEICFDSKPRIISKRNKENNMVCANLVTQHSFENNKCLVHILRSSTVKYCKIRPFKKHYQFDICRHEVRYGCLLEDSCLFAHSFMELKVWVLQQYSGMTQEDILQEAKKYWQALEVKTSKAFHNKASSKTTTTSTFDLDMKFVCGQCWRNGQVVEPDKDLKYCSAKARHSWTKERRVLLVMSKVKKKWVSVRPPPSIRGFLQQYDLCVHAQNNRKCQYVGNCTFAHSPEERDMWTFMKEHKLLDMQQIYDMWLKKHNPGRPGEGMPVSPREGEKQIQMPTDYADVMTGYHCWLCGKNSNSERQWQQHIQTEKHKEKVFTSESDADNGWHFRFPMGEFHLCNRYQKSKMCPEGERCPFAHGQEELVEWLDRREVLKQKLAKARKDMLLCPDDNDFGKYNFLLQEVV
ncbi:zinc finger CCCH domain-containing protein 7B isoform X1 [Microcaecilia unicolor]|uniref:Zinc finger CCCH domain-containing protein 7B isoform X1 n=1 Tax=Microcaecilia unicolor TaxID=1415580 RepID=A0A6P7YNK4_9AMPH|nr:zinc finger CCCH domain-containing protein 7B isoform X1 [Microcaecilia unicolor]XP_030066324.1 zinc finger CCCH domain-containing protein 7B isoform X1 [Microcaecilia unicolor]XP_030066331.1 zinc finger CCCH domain-containing protein 7B isoform X1 [Microcaecilia unicolor]